jgi:uncharacterized protein (TIGR03437 family)
MWSFRAKLLWCVASALASMSAARASISIDDVVNAASFIPSALAGGAIAQGALFAVAGKGVGPDATQRADGFPLPSTAGLAGVSVQVTVNGTTVDAILVYVSSNVVEAILPSGTPVGTGTVTVNNNGDTATAPITVVASAFGIFTARGQALAFNVSAADGSTVSNGLMQPAIAGQNAVLNGTGLGAIVSDETQSGVSDAPNSTPVLYVGGVQATIVSAGRGSCCSGIDPDYPVPQGIAAWDVITFTVPAGVAGCAVPVAVQVGGSVSNFSTISIAGADGNCYDASIQSVLGVDGGAKVGSISLTRNKEWIGGALYWTDRGNANFYQASAAPSVSQFPSTTPSYGSCTVQRGSSVALSRPSTGGAGARALDAGAALHVAGPNGSQAMARSTPGYYSGMFAYWNGPIFFAAPGQSVPFLDAGAFTIANQPGGADLDAYSFDIVNPQPFDWDTNYLVKAVDRSQGLTVTWNPSTDSAAYVQIQGLTGMKLADGSTVTGSFACVEKMSAGTFTVPSYITSALPAAPQTNPNYYGTGTLTVNSVSAQQVTIPGVDYAVISLTSGTSKILPFN